MERVCFVQLTLHQLIVRTVWFVAMATACWLTPIPYYELPKLRDLYLRDWPRNCVGYYTLDNFQRWVERDPQMKALSILAVNDDWSDGTFLIIDRYQLFVNTINPSNGRLTTALSLLDWSRGYKVSFFLERHRPAVLSIVQYYQLRTEYDSLNLLYHMTRDFAIQMEINCPDNIVLKELREEHAAVVDGVWPNRHVGSLFLMRRLIKWNPNMGAFTKDTNELVAWCLRMQSGFLGVIHVKDSHLRMGLGSAVTKSVCKKVAAMGHDVVTCVYEDNFPSRMLLEKLGFQIVDRAFLLRTHPTVDFTWSDE